MVEQLTFQLGEGGSIPTSPLQLRIIEISLAAAMKLNGAWHSTLPEYKTGFMPIAVVCYGAIYESAFYACAIWNNPSSPSLSNDWLELRRMAISPLAPRNTASRMLRVMVLLIRRRYPQYTKLISYQDTSVHYGTIYRASGWRQGNISSGSKCGKVGKYRDKELGKANAPKVRWEYLLGQ